MRQECLLMVKGYSFKGSPFLLPLRAFFCGILGMSVIGSFSPALVTRQGSFIVLICYIYIITMI